MSDLGQSEYATHSRKLMRIAQNLRDIGAQTLVDIPRIVAIGGQSAGKSSLVEAISGIRVPRDAGTCTRCPVEVNLINAYGPWTCTISLRIDFNEYGETLTEPLKIPFGPIITEQDEVDLALRRAQAAILNYRDPRGVHQFLTKTRRELDYYRTEAAHASGTLRFSKNTITLDIQDETRPNLSFVDLPGLVQNAEDDTVRLVEDLVRTNIRGNCLILVVIPMSDDMENQRAMRIALDEDRDKSRTIGILTKPDNLSVGSTYAHRRWSELLDGTNAEQAFALRKGYYCVKLPDDAEREEEIAQEGRNEREADFFSTTDPWSQITNQNRLGVPNLVNDLSKYLTTLLREMLPILRNEAAKQSKLTQQELISLPEPPPQDAVNEIFSCVAEFCQGLSDTVHGSSSASYRRSLKNRRSNRSDMNDREYEYIDKAFVQKNRFVYECFKTNIRKTAPDFRPYVDGLIHPKPEFHDQDGDDSSEEEGEGNGPLDLESIKECKKKSITWELPNNIPFDVKVDLIRDFTNEWENPTLDCFDTVVSNLAKCVDELIEIYFGRYPALRMHITELIKGTMDRQWEHADAALRATIRLESRPLYTQNIIILGSLKETWLRLYREQYLAVEQPDLQNVHDAPIRLDIQESLDIMAEVRAYFFIAYRRYIDYVPLVIEHHLNQGLADVVHRSLIERLNKTDPNSIEFLRSLLAESPGIEEMRGDLKTKLERLERIAHELLSPL